METKQPAKITVQATINALLQKVWNYWTNPAQIMKWNNANEEWHTPNATSDLMPGGRFVYRMEAKDGSMGFNFGGIYDEVETNKLIRYTIDDGRKVEVTFADLGSETAVTETFEAETTNPIEMQKAGWQAILDNFKNYVEQSSAE